MTTQDDARLACKEIGERIGEMTREGDYYWAPPRNGDAEYLLPRLEIVLGYTDYLQDALERAHDDELRSWEYSLHLAEELEEAREANATLADHVDRLVERLVETA